MNYIAEINRFHELLPQSRMTPSSIALWYGLMHIFNKAGWPEEKTVRCTVGTLAQAGEEHGIRKTALVLVGDFLDSPYEKSKLYDPTFTTEFREASR